MRNRPTTLDRVRERLRSRYLDSLPGKIAVLEQTLSEVRRDHESLDAMKTARRLAHQIRGSAASFGFAHLGTLAAALENGCDELVLAHLQSLVEGLQATMLAESRPSSAILVVEDDETVAQLIVELIQTPNRLVRTASNCNEARELLATEDFDLAILDLVLPDGDGRDLLTEIREDPRNRDIAIVVLSAKTASLVKNECAIYGVDAFIEKPIISAAVPTLVAAALHRKREFQRDAFNDELTRISNRAGFRQMFGQMHALANRSKKPLSIALLDLDRFKLLNDTHGHHIGDLALVEVANTMRSTLRRSDILGRWGGEEFVIGFPDTPADAACLALQKVADALRTKTFDTKEPIRLTFSAGVAELATEESLDLVLLRADQLLYAAKENGRNQILHRQSQDNVSAERILIVEDDPTIAMLLMQTLRDGYDVVHSKDAESAVARAEKEQFALVILDYQLPDATGLDVLRAIRSLPNNQDLAIFMLTGVASDEIVEAAFDAGADDYIIKPFRPRALRSRIRRRLEK